MIIRPAGIIFVNNDLTTSVQNALVKQLHIDEVIDGYTFDARAAAEPSYVSIIKQLDLRIMVVRPYTELDNRILADIAVFASHGLAAVLKNNFGPHGVTHPICRLTWNKICIFDR